MQCPNCHTDKVRRSTRHGLGEGLWLRILHRAPYRCQHCHLRFVAARGSEKFAAGQSRSLAAYLGLDDGYEVGLMVSAGGMLLVVLVILALLFVLLFVGDASAVTKLRR